MKQRRERLAASIQKAVAQEIMLRLPGRYVTVTEVEVSPDSKFASIWLSILDEDKQESIFAEAEEIRGALRHAITKSTDIRRLPQIELRLDKRQKHAQRISDLTRGAREKDS